MKVAVFVFVLGVAVGDDSTGTWSTTPTPTDGSVYTTYYATSSGDNVDDGWNSREQWHVQPMWYWDSPYPPTGTTYQEDWGFPPSREVGARRSFYFNAAESVSLPATIKPGRADCADHDWCVHLTFHSSYGVLSDFDAFVLDRYDSANPIMGDELFHAKESRAQFFAPLVLGEFSSDEIAVLENISDWHVREKASRFNETRITTWTLFPDDDELDVILSFKQLFTLLPGYPDDSTSELYKDLFSEWGPSDQVLLRVAAKREGSGATSVLMPRVLNFTGSQLFEVEYFSSLEYPEDLNGSANAVTLDVVFNRRRYGSGIPWNPARPSDACDVCDQRLMNHPLIARCLQYHVPERIFQSMFEEAKYERMPWDRYEWDGSNGGYSDGFDLNEAVDACFGLRWLLNGMNADGSWSSDSSQFRGTGEGSSPSGYNDAGYQDGSRWSSSGRGYNDAGSNQGSWSSSGRGYNDVSYNEGSGYSSSGRGFNDVGHQDGSRWSSSGRGYNDAGHQDSSSWSSSGRDAGGDFGGGSRWSSSWSGSAGGPDVGDDWLSVRDIREALSILRESDTGIQCLVDARCSVGNRNFAEAAGRMIVMEHDPAMVRIVFTKPSFEFYIRMGLEGLGEFSTPPIWSDYSSEYIAELVASSVPNASEYNLGVDVQISNNLEWIDMVKIFNEWLMDFVKSGSNVSEMESSWSSYSGSGGNEIQFPSLQEFSKSGSYDDVGFGSSNDGNSPTAGDAEEPWVPQPHPVPDPEYVVEISLRNVSIVPNILSVQAIGAMEGESESLSWDARRSYLRFQLAPLNLSSFQYVPPPPGLNFTWDDEITDYPDDYNQTQDGDNTSSVCSYCSLPQEDGNVPNLCSQCKISFNACNSSTSCSLGVRAFLQEALRSYRFMPHAGTEFNSTSNRQKWILGDFGAKLRQSAGFFTADGYDLFMNFTTCIAARQCGLGKSPQYPDPTLLEITPAKSLFIVPATTTGSPENVLMKFRGEEQSFSWSSAGDLQYYISNALNEYYPESSLWTRNPSAGSVQVSDVSSSYPTGTSTDRVIEMTFWGFYFIEDEPPRFKSQSSDIYNELNSTHWSAVASTYRSSDTTTTSTSPVSTGSAGSWDYFEGWLALLGSDPNFEMDVSLGNANAEEIPICYQCADSWRECYSYPQCRDALRANSMLQSLVGTTNDRTSLDISAEYAMRETISGPDVYARVNAFSSCLSMHSCPVGYALPADPSAALVPTTMATSSSFSIVFIWQEYVSTRGGFAFNANSPSADEVEKWLASILPTGSVVEVKTSMVNQSFIRFEVTCYPAIAEFPLFTSETGDVIPLEVNATFASFQLSSNRVQPDQRVSWDLLYYWFGLSADPSRMFISSGSDLFSGFQVCHGCPECSAALTRCRNNLDCASSFLDTLVPTLRNSTLAISTTQQTDGRKIVELDLSPALLSLANTAFLSREGWLGLAHLLHSISTCGCNVGFGQVNALSGEYLEPTRVLIKSNTVVVSVRIYMGTQLDVHFIGNTYSYFPAEVGVIEDAAGNFNTWFMSVIGKDPVLISGDNNEIVINYESQSATITIQLTEIYDHVTSSDIKPLLNPSWIPTFTITSSDGSNMPPAEVNVTPWGVSLQSTDRYPPFDRLLDLLVDGVSDDTSVTSSGSTVLTNVYISTGDECSRCQEQIQSCIDNDECRTTLDNTLLPSLGNIEPVSDGSGLYTFDASGQVLDAFHSMSTLPGKQKLYALLQCTAVSGIPSQGSCLQKMSSEAMPDVAAATLEITQATSSYPIERGGKNTATVYDLTGGTHTFEDNGDAVQLMDFMNGLLGSSSGVDVSVSNSASNCTVTYDGLTDLSTPHFVFEDSTSSVESYDTPMQTKLKAATRNFTAAFGTWVKWLNPDLL